MKQTKKNCCKQSLRSKQADLKQTLPATSLLVVMCPSTNHWLDLVFSIVSCCSLFMSTSFSFMNYTFLSFIGFISTFPISHCGLWFTAPIASVIHSFEDTPRSTQTLALNLDHIICSHSNIHPHRHYITISPLIHYVCYLSSKRNVVASMAAVASRDFHIVVLLRHFHTICRCWQRWRTSRISCLSNNYPDCLARCVLSYSKPGGCYSFCQKYQGS